MKKTALYIAILWGIILSACTKENPNLVNPPSAKESVRIRFMNFAGDREVRSLNFDGENIITSGYGAIGKAINPPGDSTIAGVFRNGVEEFVLHRKTKFLRESFNTFFALPSPKGSPEYRAVDTLINVGTSSGLPKNTIHTYLKVINAYPDSTISFSVIEGCPNGYPVFANMGYRSVSAQKELRAGAYPVTITKNVGDQVEVLGLFDLVLKNDLQYLIIISEGNEGEVVISLLDETNAEETALTRPNQIYEKSAFIRTINLSSEEVNISKMPNVMITSSLQPLSISDYDNIEACTSLSTDSISVEFMGFVSAVNALSIDVNKKYTLLVSDDGDKVAATSVVIPQAMVDYPYNDKALVRVINLANKDKEYNLSIGGRYTEGENSSTAGENIAQRCKFAKLSHIYPIKISSGDYRIPLTLFENSSPSKLVSSLSYKFEAGKSYLAIIHKDKNDKVVLYLVEDEEVAKPVNPLPAEQFFRLINIVHNKKPIEVSLDGVLSNAKVEYLRSLSSVARIGENKISINGQEHYFTSNKDQRDILIALGNNDLEKVIKLKSDTDEEVTVQQKAKFRFMHLADGASTLMISKGTKHGDTLNMDLKHEQLSPYYTEHRANSFSFYIYNRDEGDKLILKAEEIKIVEGKQYTIIICGNKNVGYKVFIVQEY